MRILALGGTSFAGRAACGPSPAPNGGQLAILLNDLHTEVTGPS